MKYLILLTFIVYQLLSTMAHSDSLFMDRLAYSNVYKITDIAETGGSATAFTVNYKDKRYTITNAHVCYRNKSVGKMMLQRTDHRSPVKMIVKILKIDDEKDLCLLTAANDGSPGLRVGKRWHKFQDVMVYGHPQGNTLTPSQGKLLKREVVNVPYSVAKKDCKGKDVKWESNPKSFLPIFKCWRKIDSIYTSIKVYPGNSGSPVFSERGHVVGIVFASQSTTWYGSIIPLRSIHRFLKKSAQ